MTADEFLRFERRWKLIFVVFAGIFIAALLDHMTRRPSGIEALLCYTLGGLDFSVASTQLGDLGDPDRIAPALLCHGRALLALRSVSAGYHHLLANERCRITGRQGLATQ
jgi:hypothetical protein